MTAAPRPNPSGFAFTTNPSPDGVAPRVIGPFDADADADPVGRNQGYTVNGIGWYRKEFTIPRANGGHGTFQQVEVRFDGVFQNSDVWLNGVHLGFHPNGYTSFAYSLTPYLRSGKNVLAVRVDNSGETSRWSTGSGIYRHTWLTVTSPVRIPLWGVYVTTPAVDEHRATTRVEVEVTNSSGPVRASVRATVLDPHGRVVATGTTSARAGASAETQTRPVDLVINRPALRSPETPHLHSVRTEVLVDGHVIEEVNTPFGVRSLVFNGRGFFLQRKAHKIHGGNIHHDHGPLGAVAIDRAEERSIETLKAAGFNAIRTAHNPRSPYMLDVCDRLGIFVWNEFTDTWDGGKTANDYHVYFPQWWQRDLTSMVQRDRNHPSVIIWSSETRSARTRTATAEDGGTGPLAGHDSTGDARRDEPAQG